MTKKRVFISFDYDSMTAHTAKGTGISPKIETAQELGKPCFLLNRNLQEAAYGQGFRQAQQMDAVQSEVFHRGRPLI
ncbi:hypothetical protein [Komagataeibacter nataicola]|uniref:Uncharacterized protein n=1 Tax=Komagataeibacter nataicola TaxID=265960 RepID=A0ABX5P7H5_9PROT|nr:hypothetical protein [Komagataeibacter nataicola]PYD65191.1 hypothetical protein CDI09_14955 [Komagataeibacter nataicola]WNM07533.1 hypothetical protein RI056_10495 [Komagataeibacter nataicola]GBR21944.1 hypothetical protein AA0616_2154 [Komagataeibacter nataicola NRIC 0616]